jgi:hypothetical protein
MKNDPLQKTQGVVYPAEKSERPLGGRICQWKALHLQWNLFNVIQMNQNANFLGLDINKIKYKNS